MVTVPLTAVRLRTHFGPGLSSATFAAECIYGLSGALNVALILLTRSPLLLPRSASRDRSGSGVAPSPTWLKSRHGFPEINRPDPSTLEMGTRIKPVPLGPLPEEGDVGWRLPSSKHGSIESAI